jgi:hypothetical protein
MIVMQGDFTDPPENLQELIKRFEGGADIVLAERGAAKEPVAVSRLRRLAPWALRFSLAVRGISDPYASFRLYRISLLRDLIKASGDKPLITSDGWAANVELLMSVMPNARRVEQVTLEPRYDLRVRESRIRPFADAISLYRFGRAFRGRSISLPAPPATTPKPLPDTESTGSRSSAKRERITS